MKRILQVLDVINRSDADMNHYVDVFGRDTKDGSIMRISVVGTPHSIHVALPEDYSKVNFQELVATLNYKLNSNAPRCRRFECESPSCRKNANPSYGIFRELCRWGRNKTAQVIVTGYEVIYSNGYVAHEKNQRPFLKLLVKNPVYFSALIKILKEDIQNFQGAVEPRYVGVYGQSKCGVESFCFEAGLAGFEYIEVPPGVNCLQFRDLKKVPAPEGYLPAASLVNFSLDIETIAKTYSDTANLNATNPIGIIACIVRTNRTVTGTRTFVLRSPNVKGEVDTENVRFFDSEKILLCEFKRYFLLSDPDFAFGFNSNAFDIPYIIRRAAMLGILNFDFLSRSKDDRLIFLETIKESKQKNTQWSTKIDCPGRIFIDLLQVAKETFTLDLYKLGAVCKHLKLEGKEDIEYEQIYPYFHESLETRRALISYCQTDTLRVIEIADKMNLIPTLIANCNVFRALPYQYLNRGISFRLQMLLRDFMRGRMLIYCQDTNRSNPERDIVFPHPAQLMIPGYRELYEGALRGEKYEGGYVQDPKLGLHLNPVFTFDFNSMYPSIMIQWNIDASTILFAPEEGCNTSPAGFHFVSSDVKKGIIPEVAELLLGKRKGVKNEIKAEKDLEAKKMLDALQLAYKLASNALYGAGGCGMGVFCHFPLSDSTTSIGQMLIKKVLAGVTNNPDYAHLEPDGVYGDTDSVFVEMKMARERNGVPLTTTELMTEAVELGHRVEKWINKESGILSGAMKMSFENVAHKLLLLAKKHYAECIWDVDEQKLEMKTRGIGTRSYTKFANDVLFTILKMAMLEDKTQTEVKEYLVDRFALLRKGEVETSLLLHTMNKSKEVYEEESLIKRVTSQLKQAGKEVVAGTRYGFFYCNLNIRNKTKKSELAVASDLFYESGGRYTLHVDTYVTELIDQLKKPVASFIGASDYLQAEFELKRYSEKTKKREYILTNPPDYIPDGPLMKLLKTGESGGWEKATETKKKAKKKKGGEEKKQKMTPTLSSFFK